VGNNETTASGATTLVGIEPAGDGGPGRAVRRMVLHSYPAGYHASRAAHPSQRNTRN
jgi:hypothetical protein